MPNVEDKSVLIKREPLNGDQKKEITVNYSGLLARDKIFLYQGGKDNQNPEQTTSTDTEESVKAGE